MFSISMYKEHVNYFSFGYKKVLNKTRSCQALYTLQILLQIMQGCGSLESLVYEKFLQSHDRSNESIHAARPTAPIN